MDEVSFESTCAMDQAEFGAWVARRARWDPNRYELLNGRIVMNPPAGYPHGQVGNRIQRLLGNFVAIRSLGEVFDSSQGFDLPSGDTIEPDHSYVSRERWAAMPAPEDGKFLRVAPDLVVEVLSISTASRDRGEKKAIYERNGVREYWLVDPRARTLTVFALRDADRYDRGRVFTDDDRATSDVLAGLEFTVRELLP
jgi:Uma2 family endonuclease